MCEAAVIHQLIINRFRGIKQLKWSPAPGMNIILGGGDVGKTTVLDAIALLLSPSNSLVLSEADYWQRNTDEEFTIHAVISLPASTDISQQSKFIWPWEWNGQEAIPPMAAAGDDDIPTPMQPVYCIQVRGTAEHEISWEILQPNGDIDSLTAAVRRKIGVVRLTSDDRNDRDLRLVYGSALDRLLSDNGLRARIGSHMAEIDLQEKLSEDAKNALSKLDSALKAQSLPNELELGLTTSQGLSIGALIGLHAQRDGITLPLASWGAGTRRMATLQIAAENEAQTRITVIDEIERGLEPYRARKLVRMLETNPTQSFVTTHSAVVISSADEGQLWYLDSEQQMGALHREKIARQQERDPETFLSRLSIIAEGPTEIGFVTYLLERAIDGNFQDMGVRVCNAQGNPATLDLLEAMSEGGLKFGGFVDEEGTSTGRWNNIKRIIGPRLFQWPAGSTEENVITQIPEGRLTDIIQHEDPNVTAERLKTLADRLGIEDRSLDAICAATPDLRALIIAAATGQTANAPDGDAKTWKKHGRQWFKSKKGGRELAQHMFELGAWPPLQQQLLLFLNAIRQAMGQAPPLEELHNER